MEDHSDGGLWKTTVTGAMESYGQTTDTGTIIRPQLYITCIRYSSTTAVLVPGEVTSQ